MGRIPRDAIDTVRDRVDIREVVQQVVTLRQKGSSMMGLCPFHQEKTPSFSVVPAKGIFHCFGCGEGGDVFQFVMKTRGVSFAEAVRELAEGVGVAIEEREVTPEERRRRKARATLYEVCESAQGYFRAMLETTAEGKKAREYLAERGLDQQTIEGFGLGFAPERWDGMLKHLDRDGVDPELAVRAGLARWRDASQRHRGAYDLFRNRVIVPIHDDRGRVVAFGGRVMPGASHRSGDPPPKYVNSPETEIYKKSSVLYGLSRARSAIQRNSRMILVEGYFDVIALSQRGFPETVATCGTALTRQHLEIVRRLTGTVVALFDADEAGENAAAKSLPMFLEVGIEPLRLDLGDSKDPDDYLAEKGAEAFEGALGRAEPLFELVLRRVRRRHPPTPVGQRNAIRELAPILRLYSEASRHLVVTRMARAFGLHERAITEEVGRAVQSTQPAPEVRRDVRAWRPSRDLYNILWMLLHHCDLAAPVVMKADPEQLTDRASVRQAMGMLMVHKPLTEILDALDDDAVARVLRQAELHTGLYTEDQVQPALVQMLAKIEVSTIKCRLSEIDSRISGCDPSNDASTYFELMSEKQSLQRKLVSIKNPRARPASADP